MALQPLSAGDVLLLSQTAWKIGRAFTLGKTRAPAEFAEVEREAAGLSEALKLVAEALYEDDGILSHAPDDAKSAVIGILQSAHQTLDDIDSFVDRYQVIRRKETGHGFVVERTWSEVVLANYKTFKWTTEGGNIAELRNMLRVHTHSITLTMQALQSPSLARLEQTVMPMSENRASMYHRVHGHLGHQADDAHPTIMSIANSTPSLVAAQDRQLGPGSTPDSTNAPSTSGTLPVRQPEPMESPDPRSSSCTPPRPGPPARIAHPTLVRPPTSRPRVSGASRSATAGVSSDRENFAYHSPEPLPLKTAEDHRRAMDWEFETGSPMVLRGSIADDNDAGFLGSPKDSAYGSLPRNASTWRESATSFALFKAVEDEYNAAAGTAAGSIRAAEEATPSPEQSPRSVKSTKSRVKRLSWRALSSPAFLPPPAIPADDDSHHHRPPATPKSFFSNLQRTKSNLDDRPQTAKSVRRSAHRQTIGSRPTSTDGGLKFEKQLFRNAAILCDVRGRLVEYAHFNPDEPDPRYNVEMLEACKEARIYVIRKRENREHGGTKVVTSLWCISYDGEVRMQQKLSGLQETIPYCSYFEPEKVSLQPDDAQEDISLRFHSEEWGQLLKDEKKTNWVNYFFASESDAIAFQSATFGRMLMGSYRTTKTTVLHEGFKGAFALEEQFANMEMLRVWEDDGVSTPGAEGGVLALMHVSSNFGEGWARWWMNNSKQDVKVKEDGAKFAKVKGVEVKVVKPRTTAAPVERTRTASFVGEEVAQVQAGTRKAATIKQVGGIRIEFKTDEERNRFVSMAKRCQENLVALPDL